MVRIHFQCSWISSSVSRSTMAVAASSDVVPPVSARRVYSSAADMVACLWDGYLCWLVVDPRRCGALVVMRFVIVFGPSTTHFSEASHHQKVGDSRQSHFFMDESPRHRIRPVEISRSGKHFNGHTVGGLCLLAHSPWGYNKMGHFDVQRSKPNSRVSVF